MKKIAKGKPGKNRIPPKEKKPAKQARSVFGRLSLKGSPRPKVSLFLDRGVRDMAKAKAAKLGLSLTQYIERLTTLDVGKKAA
jgi:hypothetical protein